MSDNKQFDGFFKQSFTDYSPVVPPHIWENIAAEKKKKKAGFFWLTAKKTLLTMAVLLLAGIGSFIAFHQKNSSRNIAHENNGSRQDAERTVPAAVLEDKTGKETASVPAAANEEPVNAAASSPASRDKVPGEFTIAATPEKTTGKVVAGKKMLNGKETYGDLYTGNADDIAGNRKNNKRKAGKENRSSEKMTRINPPAAALSDDGANDIAGNDPVNDGLIIPFVEGGREKIDLSAKNIFGKQTIQPTPAKLFEDCPGSASGNNYYIEAYVSPDYVFKNYSDTGNSTLVQKRKETLHFQSAYSAGFRYTRVFSNGMSIRAGFNFSQVKEKFSYAQDNVVQIVYVINPAGDTTDSYYVRGTRFKTSYNHYRTIDVPVVVGYEMGNGNFHANINAGVMINLYSWQKGETLDNNGAPVSITTGKDDNPYQYRTNVGVGFTGAVSLYYRFSEKFHVLAEPYLRYNFSPMSRETVSIQEKFTTIGLRLGVRMDIK